MKDFAGLRPPAPVASTSIPKTISNPGIRKTIEQQRRITDPRKNKHMNKLSITSRILVAFASGALVAVFFLPAWRIDLFAPQYPEGLTMNIWINGLSGDVDVINGLNHYIGMKHVTPEMFPEFTYLPWVVGFFMLLGMAIAITGSRKFLFYYICLTALGGALAMYDFYRWSYDYGHNLDPKAPIQVPGLSYQPPLIGHKRLLNFDAYSMPHVAGWIVIAAGTLAFCVWFAEWYRHRQPKRKVSSTATALLLAITLFTTSCNTKPKPFVPGKDACDFCKMGLSDLRFGGEIITKKGKIYKFDDQHCLAAFLNAGTVKENEIGQLLVMNFENPNNFLEATQAVYLQDATLKSPMGSNIAAFRSANATLTFTKGRSVELLDWNTLKAKLK